MKTTETAEEEPDNNKLFENMLDEFNSMRN